MQMHCTLRGVVRAVSWESASESERFGKWWRYLVVKYNNLPAPSINTHTGCVLFLSSQQMQKKNKQTGGLYA